jgi:hypothetical protein
MCGEKRDIAQQKGDINSNNNDDDNFHMYMVKVNGIDFLIINKMEYEHAVAGRTLFLIECQ